MAARRPARSTSSRTSSPRTTAAHTTAPSVPAQSAPAASSASSASPASALSASAATAVRTDGPTPTFAELGVPAALTELLAVRGITSPFPIQAASLPDALAGRDVLGRGRTGSGKTLGFLLPVLARLAATPRKRRPNRPRALILAPTRELATQIDEAAAPLAAALGLRTTTVFGGVGARPQISALRSGIDLVIACPGRLLDHLGEGHAILDAVEITVLDEADHMADLGFLPMVKRILDATPPKSQRLLFSATLDNGIDQLVRRYLNDPVTHSVDSAHSEVPDMTHHVLHVEAEDRVAVLIELAAAPGRTIVFTRTKHAAKKLTSKLTAARVPAVELHGNLTQGARTRNLAAFAEGRATTLVATDIAARGIHVDDVALVVHADPPMEHKAYLHRSGRTARAGSSGTVITLMTDAQVGEVRELTRKARIKATTTRTAPGDPFISTLAPGERLLVRPEQIAALTGRAPAAESDGAAPAPARSGGGNGSRNGNRRRRGTGGGGGASGPVATGSNGTGGTGGEVGAGGARQRGGAKKNSGAMKTGGTPKSGASQKNTERAARGSATGGAKAGGGSSRASSAAGKTGGAVAASRGFRSRRSG